MKAWLVSAENPDQEPGIHFTLQPATPSAALHAPLQEEGTLGKPGTTWEMVEKGNGNG